MFAYCGLCCSTCAIYQAHTKDDPKFKKLAHAIYKRSLKGSGINDLEHEDIKCEGCRSDVRFKYCQTCDIRSCCKSRGFYMCYQCNQFPCAKVSSFPVESARNAMLETALQCEQYGHEKHLHFLEKKHTCNNCGTILFRGATRCSKCRLKLKTT